MSPPRLSTVALKALIFALVTAAAACASDDGGGAAAATTGDALLAFTCKGSVHKASKLVDPLKGSVYGNLFLTEDVTAAGPIAGAVMRGAVEVSNLDLVGEGKVDGAFRTPKLPPNTYTFLGFFDVDGNGAVSKDPDAGDPVTLAITNKFIITAGQTTSYTATFDLVLN